ncbi:bifunctional DNA-formamidopyrimidine glycosylase/DNA-(apurinic or apyrimidinic site) lyase [Patescibacteria group bacterium]|nr:bifunctional DNA-formamidopyrimidine glycosylase/DNA-(apurinic or apyrimidinic site) lyase [Patescibacteria group bacterium]
MPELPEVETLKLGLRKYLVGHKIQDIDIRVPKIFQGDRNKAIGSKVTDIKRVGKGLIIELNNGFDLAIHLKLTGQLIYQGIETTGIEVSDKAGGALPSKHTHIIFTLDPSAGSGQAAKLFYNDLRKFGWIRVIRESEVKNLPFFKEMGPEPYKLPDLNQKTLTLSDFQLIVRKSGLPIKILLMDQKKIGGIGNIYANEALFKAKISPQRKANNLSDREIKQLYKEIFEVIRESVSLGGSSDVNFVNALGQEGEYQRHFLVYSRAKEKCKRCKGTIEKIQLGGRGTYFCPNCQH